MQSCTKKLCLTVVQSALEPMREDPLYKNKHTFTIINLVKQKIYCLCGIIELLCVKKDYQTIIFG